MVILSWQKEDDNNVENDQMVPHILCRTKCKYSKQNTGLLASASAAAVQQAARLQAKAVAAASKARPIFYKHETTTTCY